MSNILQDFPLDIHSLPLFHRGKVRDSYLWDDNHLLIIATDRISAFDVVLPEPIPDKGKILTQITHFWLDYLDIKNHRVNFDLKEKLSATEIAKVKDRAMVVKKCKPLPIEAIVRGYIIGSGWKDYQETGAICGIALPEHLQLADKFSQPLFTPSSKAKVGEHDENITLKTMQSLIGEDLAAKIQTISLNIYQKAQNFANNKGLIIADTKFEFGLDNNNALILIDEVLTPDSSRYWPKAYYQLGVNPPSYDKQFVRDYLNTLHWDKKPPAPHLPNDIIQQTQAKYYQLQEILLS